MEFTPGYIACVVGSGVFLITGLLTGVWKYLQIRRSAEAQAHPYVDIAHRAALMYAFASLVLAKFVELSVWSDNVNLAAAAITLIYFAIAIGSYVLHAVRADTDNQLRDPDTLTIVGMWTLIVAEIAGVVVLFSGVLVRFFG